MKRIISHGNLSGYVEIKKSTKEVILPKYKTALLESYNITAYANGECIDSKIISTSADQLQFISGLFEQKVLNELKHQAENPKKSIYDIYNKKGYK